MRREGKLSQGVRDSDLSWGQEATPKMYYEAL